MRFPFARRDVAIAALAALGSTTLSLTPTTVAAAGKTPGRYVSGDFHNHTTCSDGSISMQKLVKKVTDKVDTPWGLDWFVQAGHGGNGNRNCTLVEDESLSTPSYPYVAGKGPTTTWSNSIGAANIKGDGGGVGGNGNMWRWQSIQEFQYPVLEYLAVAKNQPLFIGMESVVAGHEHTSMSIVTGQMPAAIDNTTLPASGSFAALGNANALAQWSYCFDRGDTDKSRGNVTGSNVGNNWNCAVPGSASESDPSWNAAAQKLIPAGGTGTGTRGHLKTVEALKWMARFHPDASYYVPAHLERAGPFYADGNQGFNVEHLRNFNNAAPAVAFGFESQPGHGASSNRGEYQVNRNTFGSQKVDSVGGTTFGGTGVYAGIVGGVWDALLGEGRNFWFFASSDWHNRGSFGPDDRRSTQDFYPGEYQRTSVMVRNGSDKLRPQAIVNGLRSGNAFSTTGQLIDRLSLVACASYPGLGARTNAAVEAIAVTAATNNTDTDVAGCATMGEKLVVRPGAEIVVAVVVRDPAGTNYSPYSFPNPSLLQVGVNQPINQPVLDHIDLIRGMVTGYRTPGSADYAGEWPRNTDWLRTDGTTTGLANVPAAAKNTTAAVIRTFNGAGATPWVKVNSGVDNSVFLKMSYRIPAVTASQYVRLRGTNLPAAVPFETDPSGNPLADLYTNANDTTKLRIPCTTVGTNVPANGGTYTGTTIDGCPAHLPVVGGVKYVAYDVAAWSDLWFYSNPVYVEVTGTTQVAGVK
ncbi:hypothetical protein CDN99_15115 [Roseateles aquatilis]|uniref:DUF3604 domain-containing protein n=1 Tax=Roseateles aquatilis TaxID=431061 RepID=A0A246J9A8_9BURK|nr:hypothetical protein [Roseateles aquatilis]OWQ88808.1 hypothetical protein CDN99_15115 [Roseateles aquatilis]